MRQLLVRSSSERVAEASRHVSEMRLVYYETGTKLSAVIYRTSGCRVSTHPQRTPESAWSSLLALIIVTKNMFL